MKLWKLEQDEDCRDEALRYQMRRINRRSWSAAVVFACALGMVACLIAAIFR